MNIVRNRILSFLCACLLAMPLMSQTHRDTLWLNRPVSKFYKFSDNLFWGTSFGGSYSFSEYVRKEAFFKMLGPGVDFEFGKHLSRQWAARVMLGYHSYQSSFPKEVVDKYPEAYHYSFSTIGGYLDAMYCLNRLFRPYNPGKRNLFWFFFGAGGMVSFGYAGKMNEWKDAWPIDNGAGIYPACRVGIEWHRRVSRGTSVLLRGLFATTNSAFDGKVQNCGSARHFVELSVGFRVGLPNRYGQRHFEYCGHNANRYFNVMNDRLERLHRKMSTKGMAWQNMCESDSILLFPRDYRYLTDMQKSKLRRMAAYLREHEDVRANIHIYGDENVVGGMEMEFRVVNRAERVDDYLGRELQLDKGRYVISTHPNEPSPYGQQHIFTLGGIIRYEKMPQTSL